MAYEIFAVIADTETTGPTVGVDQVVESAFMTLPKTPAEFMKAPIETLVMRHQYFGHTAPMTLGAQDTHHILPSTLAGLEPMPYPADLPPMTYIIGHNVDFDRDMLDAKGAKAICTLALAREYLPGLDSYKQGAVLYHLAKISKKGEEWARDLLRNAHSADADVMNCARILKYLIFLLAKSYPDVKGGLSWEDIYQTSQQARVPKIMTFGEFKGQPISAVRQGWAEWYAKQDNTDPWVLVALRKEGLINA